MSVRICKFSFSQRLLALGLFAILHVQCRAAIAILPITDQPGGNAATPRSNPDSRKAGSRDDSLRNFRTALAEISRELHALIITEGAPLVKDLDDAKFAELQKSISAAASNQFEDKLSTVASAFDYDVVRLDDRTFLLQKRYRNSYELPLVTYEELARSVRSILYVVDSYSHATPQFGSTALTAFYASLTPDQKQQAKSGISFSNLDESQRSLARVAIERLVLDTRVGALRDVGKALAAFPRADCSFQWLDATVDTNKTVKAFGYAGNFGVGGAPLVRPLTAPFESLGAGGYSAFKIRQNMSALPGNETLRSGSAEGDSLAEKVGAEFLSDPTVPNRLDRIFAASSEMAGRNDGTLTLRQAAQREFDADRATPSPASPNSVPTSVEVIDAISDKPVNVFGFANRGDARHFLRAKAQVYGLELLVDEHSHYRITLPQPHIPDSPQEVPAEIARLTPPPLLRALAGRASAILSEENKIRVDEQGAVVFADSKGQQIPGLAEARQRAMGHSATSDAAESLYFSAARRVIAAAEPLVPTVFSSPVPIATLAPESNRLVALTMLCGPCLLQLRDLQRFVPPQSLISPDSAIFQARMIADSDGVEDLAIGVGYLRDDGAMSFDAKAQNFHTRPDGTFGPRPKASIPTAPPQ